MCAVNTTSPCFISLFKLVHYMIVNICMFVTVCMINFCPETDQHANNEREHENGEPSCQHEEEQSPANYSM